MTVVMPAMTAAQEQAWLTLFQLTSRLGRTWCLVGGQMVHMYCAERGLTPVRATEDADAMLDVRAQPDILERFTKSLLQLGWDTAGESPEGHQHRWLKGTAQIDVLIPSKVGRRATDRRGATGGTTIEAAGGQQAIDRAEVVSVDVAGTVGEVLRPNMAGALVMKAAAYCNPQDRYRERHLTDFALLSAMINRSDELASVLGRRDLGYLRPALADLGRRPDLIAAVEGADRGGDLLGRICQAEH